MSHARDMRIVIRACEEQGLVYDPTHKHPRIVDPRSGKYVSFSATPNCPYAPRRMLRDVKHYLGIAIRLK